MAACVSKRTLFVVLGDFYKRKCFDSVRDKIMTTRENGDGNPLLCKVFMMCQLKY